MTHDRNDRTGHEQEGDNGSQDERATRFHGRLLARQHGLFNSEQRPPGVVTLHCDHGEYRIRGFHRAYRGELIRRCQVKVASRPSPPETKTETHHGLPLFLDQLCEELRMALRMNEIGPERESTGTTFS